MGGGDEGYHHPELPLLGRDDGGGGDGDDVRHQQLQMQQGHLQCATEV